MCTIRDPAHLLGMRWAVLVQLDSAGGRQAAEARDCPQEQPHRHGRPYRHHHDHDRPDGAVRAGKNSYDKGIKGTGAEMATLNIESDIWHQSGTIPLSRAAR